MQTNARPPHNHSAGHWVHSNSTTILPAFGQDNAAKRIASCTKQSRTMSFAEAATNVAVGLAFAFVVQIAIFPMFGISITAADNLFIAVIFTAVSLVRSFTLRRAFEAFRAGSGSTGNGARP
jgi:hypothetical protein